MIKGIQKESTTATTYIYPVEASETNATVLPIHALSNDYISVSVAQPLSAGLGRSIQIDLKEQIKTKINSMLGIQKEPTNVLNYIYPVEVSDTTATVLPLTTRANDFIDILLAQPLTAGVGRSVSIDLKDTIKTKINTIPNIILSSSAVPRDIKLIELDGNNVVVKNLRSGDTNFIDIQYRTELPFINSLGVAVDLNATVKMKIHDIQSSST